MSKPAQQSLGAKPDVMTEDKWAELWRRHVRPKGSRLWTPVSPKHFRNGASCTACNRTLLVGVSRRDPALAARWLHRHGVGCPRQLVRALPPVADIIAEWTPRDLEIEAALVAVEGRDADAARVLEDFYGERDFYRRASKVLRRAGYRYGMTPAEREASFASASPATAVIVAYAESITLDDEQEPAD